MLRHTLIYFVGFGASGAIALLSTSVYTRLISPAEYGQYAVLQMFVSALLAGVFEWTRVSLLRSLGPGKANGSAFFTDYAVLYFLGTVSALAIAGGFGVFGAYDLASSAWILAAAWVAAQAAMDTILVYARVAMRPMNYVRFQVARAAASFALSVTFVLMGLGAIGLVLGVALGNAGIASLGMLIYKPRHIHFRVREASAAHMREIVAFGAPVGLAALLSFGVGYADRLLVATFLDPASVGAYAFTGDFVQRTLVLLTVVVSTAAFPHTMRIFDEQGKDAARTQMSYNFAVLAAVLLPTGIGLGIAADVVANIVAGPAFREQFVRILPWLVLSGMIGGVRYYVSDMPLQLVRETGLLLWPSGMTLLLSIGFGLVLIPRYGIHGALAATNASQLIGLAVSLAITRRVFRFIFPWRDLTKLAAAIIAMVLTYRFVSDLGDLAWKLAAMIAAASAYIAVFVLLDGLGLRRHLKKRVRR